MIVSRLATLICGAVLAVAFQSGAARAELKKQWIDYKDGDGPLYGYLVYDDAFSGKRPGVLLVPSRAGMSQTALNVPQRAAIEAADDFFGRFGDQYDQRTIDLGLADPGLVELH